MGEIGAAGAADGCGGKPPSSLESAEKVLRRVAADEDVVGGDIRVIAEGSGERDGEQRVREIVVSRASAHRFGLGSHTWEDRSIENYCCVSRYSFLRTA